MTKVTQCYGLASLEQGDFLFCEIILYGHLKTSAIPLMKALSYAFKFNYMS